MLVKVLTKNSCKAKKKGWKAARNLKLCQDNARRKPVP